MIINYDATMSVLKEAISEYENSPNYSDNVTFKNIVAGLSVAINRIDYLRFNSGYKDALAGLDKYQLGNVKECIEEKIRAIEEAGKIQIYRLSTSDNYFHFMTLKEAKLALLNVVTESMDKPDEDLSEYELEIKPIRIYKEELSSYITDD